MPYSLLIPVMSKYSSQADGQVLKSSYRRIFGKGSVITALKGLQAQNEFDPTAVEQQGM